MQLLQQGCLTCMSFSVTRWFLSFTPDRKKLAEIRGDTLSRKLFPKAKAVKAHFAEAQTATSID